MNLLFEEKDKKHVSCFFLNKRSIGSKNISPYERIYAPSFLFRTTKDKENALRLLLEGKKIIQIVQSHQDPCNALSKNMPKQLASQNQSPHTPCVILLQQTYYKMVPTFVVSSRCLGIPLLPQHKFIHISQTKNYEISTKNFMGKKGKMIDIFV